MPDSHDVISRWLRKLQVGAAFHAIHAGKDVPLLTDYFIRRIPEDEWNCPPPKEFVDGRELTPLFWGGDSYAIYCVDNDSNELYEIDPEEPWPPTRQFKDWNEFVVALFNCLSEEKSVEERAVLRSLLGLES